MSDDLRLMCVLAHPDDESLGTGGSLAKYAAEGVTAAIVCATRGERGRYGNRPERPSFAELGRIREAELRCAARTLGVADVAFLDYIDGDLDQADPREAISRIVSHLRRFRPHVVVTFGPEGAYGHPDHIAISQFTAAAIPAAADASFNTGDGTPHRVAKLYYMAWTHSKWAAYQEAFKDLKTTVDGVERRATPWLDWIVTTEIATDAYWETVWKAIRCHQTQLTIYERLEHLPEEYHRGLWGSQEFYRVMSAVNGGRGRETDLFEGLR